MTQITSSALDSVRNEAGRLAAESKTLLDELDVLDIKLERFLEACHVNTKEGRDVLDALNSIRAAIRAAARNEFMNILFES